MAAMIILPAWLAIRSSASNEVNRFILIDATGAGLGQSVLANLKLDSAAARAKDPLAPTRPELRIVAPSGLAAAEDRATAEVQRPHSYAGYLALTDSTLVTGKARYAGRNASSIGRHDTTRGRDQAERHVRAAGPRRRPPEVIKDISKIRVDIATERISEKGKSGSAAAAIGVGFFLAFMLYMSIMLHGQNVMRGVLEEKMTRVAEIVISSVKPDTLLAGKVLGVGPSVSSNRSPGSRCRRPRCTSSCRSSPRA